jgi:DNA/RNA-binding domain of Phe-tRNA-synthetase-like protein
MSSDHADFSLVFDPSLGQSSLQAALVWASGLAGCAPTESAPAYLSALLERVRGAGETFLSPERKASVRDMLRHGKYKPAGRAKPSSEYLLAAALAGEGHTGEFPLVNGPVDANNAVSLEWGYPASVFDADKTGPELLLRRGLAGEAYVFNPSGQSIELEDLLVVCRRTEAGSGAVREPVWEPCGNPVKDAMVTKVFEGARNVVAVVYAPAGEEPGRLERCAARFRELLISECGAAEAGYSVIPG